MSGCGSLLFRTPSDAVWNALLDPVILRAAIPGALEVQRIDAGRFRARISFGVGWIAGHYTAELVLTNMRQPWSLDLSGSSEGTFGRGEASAQVELRNSATDGTRLNWQYRGTVSGPVAFAGRRLIQVASDLFIQRVFANLSRHMNARSVHRTTLGDITACPD